MIGKAPRDLKFASPLSPRDSTRKFLTVHQVILATCPREGQIRTDDDVKCAEDRRLCQMTPMSEFTDEGTMLRLILFQDSGGFHEAKLHNGSDW